MNTLGDTNEAKARPSVWPVYVAAVVVLIVGLASFAMVSTFHSLMSIAKETGESVPDAFFQDVMLAQATLGLLGVVAAIGMLRLRRWGWWCGIVFTGVWIAGNVLALLGMIFAAVERAGGHGPLATPQISTIAFIVVCFVVAVLLIVVLATRRRLFFPPKPAGEQ